jgi:hypothetical protein
VSAAAPRFGGLAATLATLRGDGNDGR